MPQSRRRLLKSLAVGGGAVLAGKSLPETWTRPVVDSVALPAHAQLSGEVQLGRYAGLNEMILGESGAVPSVLDFFVRPANAQNGCERVVVGICIDVNRDESLDVTICTDSTLENEFFSVLQLQGADMSGEVDDYMVSGTFDNDADPPRIDVLIEGPCPEIGGGGDPVGPDISVTITATLGEECCQGGPLEGP